MYIFIYNELGLKCANGPIVALLCIIEFSITLLSILTLLSIVLFSILEE